MTRAFGVYDGGIRTKPRQPLWRPCEQCGGRGYFVFGEPHMAMTVAEAEAWRAKEDAFRATPIGAAFHRFKNAHARAWIMDTEDSCLDWNRKATKEAHDAAAAAERELRTLFEGLCR